MYAVCISGLFKADIKVTLTSVRQQFNLSRESKYIKDLINNRFLYTCPLQVFKECVYIYLHSRFYAMSKYCIGPQFNL